MYVQSPINLIFKLIENMKKITTNSPKSSGASGEEVRKLNQMIEELSKNEKENVEEQKKQNRRSEIKNNFSLLFNLIRFGLETCKDIGDG